MSGGPRHTCTASRHTCLAVSQRDLKVAYLCFTIHTTCVVQTSIYNVSSDDSVVSSAHITCFPVGVCQLFDLEILENGRCYTSGLHWCFSLSLWQAFFFRKSTANHPVRVRYPTVVQFNLVQQVPSWEASCFFSNQPFRCCFTQNPLGYFWEEHIIRGESST